ncbi:MAG: DUF1489 domain-containing protein [Novosphingobium sp.]|nr:DUF1489 domain-containing protein [Novosphingobium sp.]MCP5379399.1 DUF1489 domain-containing protein [Novosphingobium sp.]MCP5388486.1 DUF1489 domain-containing protein [Novosphingobium sp.]
MPLSMTKVAFGAKSVEDVRRWFETDRETCISTRYLPKRHEEMVGGSIYWIFEHALIGRTPITGFAQREDGRWNIHLESRLILVEPRARRAHQGWRYLNEGDAPPDLAQGMAEGDVMPGRLVRELAKLGLV